MIGAAAPRPSQHVQDEAPSERARVEPGDRRVVRASALLRPDRGDPDRSRRHDDGLGGAREGDAPGRPTGPRVEAAERRDPGSMAGRESAQRAPSPAARSCCRPESASRPVAASARGPNARRHARRRSRAASQAAPSPVATSSRGARTTRCTTPSGAIRTSDENDETQHPAPSAAMRPAPAIAQTRSRRPSGAKRAMRVPGPTRAGPRRCRRRSRRTAPAASRCARRRARRPCGDRCG